MPENVWRGSATKFYEAGPVTRGRVDARTRELAAIAGRTPPHVSQADYEQAKREVTGESESDRQDAALDAPASSLATHHE